MSEVPLYFSEKKIAAFYFLTRETAAFYYVCHGSGQTSWKPLAIRQKLTIRNSSKVNIQNGYRLHHRAGYRVKISSNLQGYLAHEELPPPRTTVGP
jgi:hypothetical protein